MSDDDYFFQSGRAFRTQDDLKTWEEAEIVYVVTAGLLQLSDLTKTSPREVADQILGWYEQFEETGQLSMPVEDGGLRTR